MSGAKVRELTRAEDIMTGHQYVSMQEAVRRLSNELLDLVQVNSLMNPIHIGKSFVAWRAPFVKRRSDLYLGNGGYFEEESWLFFGRLCFHRGGALIKLRGLYGDHISRYGVGIDNLRAIKVMLTAEVPEV